MKKIIVVVLALILMLTLAACNGGTPSSTPGDTPGGTTQQPGGTTPQPGTSPGPGGTPAESRFADFPSRNINILMPHAAGTGFDTLCRMGATMLPDALGSDVTVFVTNITDGMGARAFLDTLDSPPDGYTLLFTGFPDQYVGQLLFDRPYEIERLTPLITITASQNTLMVPLDFPYDDLDEMIDAYLAGNMIEIVTGDSGAGAATHVEAMAVFNTLGLPIRSVHFASIAEAVAAFERNEINMIAISTGSAPMYAEMGNVKFLSVQGRINDIPEATNNAMTIFESRHVTTEQAERIVALCTGYRTFFAPPDMDPELREILTNALLEVFGSDEYTEWAIDAGWEIIIHHGQSLTDTFAQAVLWQLDMLDVYRAGLGMN